MNGLLTETFLTALIAGTITAGIPLLLAGLGEQMSQKAGVLNIGLEGMILAGSYAGFAVTLHYADQPIWSAAVGMGAGLAAGLLVGMIMAILAVQLGLNQIVIGIALLLGIEGLTAILHHLSFSQSYPRLPAAFAWAVPGLSRLPGIGPAVFDRSPVVYVAFLLVPLFSGLYRFTHAGILLQAAGDSPEALDAAGGNVWRVRMIAVLVAGACAGLGGAFMAIAGAGIFVPFMANGAGFIAIILAMLARGRPLMVLFGAILFGSCLSVATALQVAGMGVPTDVVQMLPFAAVLLILALFGRRGALPATLGEAYHRNKP